MAGLFLVVAILSFTGLAYQKVPMSITQTITQKSTEAGVSYSRYFAANTITYTTTNIQTVYATGIYPITMGIAIGDYTPCYPQGIEACTFSTWTLTYTSSITHTAQSTYEMQNTATLSYTQTLTSSPTESSTNFVPAYSSLGLSDAAFGTLSILVIGVLAFVTGWFALNSKKQRKRWRKSVLQTACPNCRAINPSEYGFCGKCGQSLDSTRVYE